MSSPFVAEIRIVGFNFAPRGWAFCNGQLLPLSQNTALFSLVGTNYGGNGTTNFGLPNFQGNAPMFYQQGPGLTDRVIGETGGSQSVTLLQNQMPPHNHSYTARPTPTTPKTSPVGSGFARSNSLPYSPTATASASLGATAIQPNGSGLPHNNMMPYLTMNFIIALQGIFPPRG
jgi:microcystin-dependent protein